MINLVSVLFVLGIQLISGVTLFILRSQNNNQERDNNYTLRFMISILGGTLPLALLSSNIVERDGLAVIFALVGFVYFIFIKKT